jgi:hypothetical protein
MCGMTVVRVNDAEMYVPMDFEGRPEIAEKT